MMKRLLLAAAAALALVVPAQAQNFLGFLPTDSLVGRDTAGTGQAESITLGSGLAFNGSRVLSFDSTIIDTSAELRALITDETGTGAAMFGITSAMADDIGCSALQGIRRNAGDNAWECAQYALLTANTFTALQTVDIGAAVTAAFEAESDDSGAASFEGFVCDRNSASPTSGDAVCDLVFYGRDSGGAQQRYGSIGVDIVDATAAGEDGQLELRTVIAGLETTEFYIIGGMASANSTGPQGIDTINLDAGSGKGYYVEGNAVQNGTECTLTDGANIAWALSDCPTAKVTIAGARTLDNPTGMMAGATYILRVINDATGGRSLVYGTAYKFPGGTDPVASTGANDVDLLSCYSDGTSMFCTMSKDFS